MPFIPNPAGGEFVEVSQEEYNSWTEAQSTASSGEVVEQEAQARSENATTSTPSDQAGRDTPIAQDQVNQDRESGTDDRIRKTIETQATPPADTNSNTEAYTTTQAGAGAESEDSGKATKNSTATSIDATFGSAPIVPQPNILDQYASYTYQFSLYLMKPDDYRAMILNKKKKILPGPQLLIQSGGAPVGGRNTYFSNDYYIDKVTLRSAITGKGTNAAHNVNDIKMTIIEPSGITLLGNLDKAVQGYLGSASAKKKNFTAAIYLLVLRFYGYDDAGNLVRGGTPTALQGGGGVGGAFVEKYYPITLNKINFKVANKIVEYEIEATAVQTTIAAGSARGTIPYNVELGAMTVQEALNGPVDIAPPQRTGGFTNEELDKRARDNGVTGEGEDPAPPAPPPNAAAAKNPKVTVRRGLAEALNQFQRELVNKGVYTYPDTYTIEFTDPALAQASIQVKNPEITATASAPPTTAAQQVNPATNSTDFKTRNISVIAGNQIVQLIDTVMKNSTYITAQALVTKSEAGTGKQQPNSKPGNNIATYKINMTATPKTDKYDPKRNDYAYDIKYTISPYKVVGLVSDYFPIPKYNGVHKQYNYWFTGENTQVLSYEQTYNALYYAVLSGSQNQQVGTIVQDTMKTSYQPRSGESSQGAKNGVNEIGANFTDYLYSPGDLANATIQIIGDPAWLQQGDINPVSKGNFKSGPFMPDGTINYDSQQILFEILINTPGDYNLETGIIDPNVRNTIFNTGRRPGATKQSYIYIANDCVSEFNKGSFKQVVKGSLLSYLPDQTFKQQQQNGRPVGAAAIPGAAGNRTAANGRITNNPGATDNNGEWDTSSGVGILKEDLPTDNTEESDPISIPEPQPQPDPEAPTSDGDLEPISDDYTQTTESTDPQYQQDNASVPEPDYNSGLAGTTAPSQLMDRET